MNVKLAKSAGFCYGVERAVKLAEQTAREKGGCVMLGSIIHNANVVAELERLGARQVDSVEAVQPGETVIIRSHGEKKDVIDYLEKIGAPCVNATCPNVLRIQQLVAKADEEGRIPIIIGELHHPEVMGVASWSDKSVILEGPEEVQKWLDAAPENRNLPVTVVAQTTCIRAIWESSEEILKKECTNAKIFDTICNATSMRQEEAGELSKVNDAIIVVGGKHSSNTAKLFDVCKANCNNTYYVETASELSGLDFADFSSIGVVAGASTPAGIIKEVIKTMSEILQPVEEQMEVKESVQKSFEEMTDEEAFEASLSSLTGD